MMFALAWQRLEHTHGRLRINDPARELDVSRSYLNKRFNEQIGLSPKAMACVLRFRRTTHLLTSTGNSAPRPDVRRRSSQRVAGPDAAAQSSSSASGSSSTSSGSLICSRRSSYRRVRGSLTPNIRWARSRVSSARTSACA